MNWYSIISLIISASAVILSILSYRQNKNIQNSKEFKDKFSEYDKKFDVLYEQFNKLGILEERTNNEIAVSTKYRDKFDNKLDEILKVIYAQK